MHNLQIYGKMETVSPTVSTESFLLTLIIDIYKHYNVTTTNVVSTYLNASIPNQVLMCINGDLINIYLQMYPALKCGLITNANGCHILFVFLTKPYMAVSRVLSYNMTYSQMSSKILVLN